MPRRKIVGALQKRRKHSRLPNRKIFRWLSEISLGSRLCPIQPASEIHSVQVELHDLILWHRPFDPHREKDFEYFSVVCAIPQIEDVPGQLLGDCTRPLADTTGLGVLEQGSKPPVKVDAAVFVKSVVLLRNDSVDQIG